MGEYMSQEDFKFETDAMQECVSKLNEVSKDIFNLKAELDTVESSLLNNWAGKGRNEFEKNFRLISQQFKDINAETEEMVEGMRNVIDTYVQADIDLAKQMDGKDSRF